MKIGILAGGVGSRLSEETTVKPKPMVEIGDRPILWHIMRYYYEYGFDEFVIGLGYRGEYIKRWFYDETNLASNITVRSGAGTIEAHGQPPEDWTVELIETGLHTNTGGRIKRLIPYMGGETFMMTWGDGVGTVDLKALLEFHRSHGKLATLTAVRPPARYGHLDLNGNQVVEFSEKPQASEGWINGAFFVLEPEVGNYIDGDDTLFEREPLQRLAAEGQLMAYHHEDFWACMDTLRDKVMLERLWASEKPPWRIWS